MRRASPTVIATAPSTTKSSTSLSADLSADLLKKISLQTSPERAVTGLNHFNITASTTLIEQVKRFYLDILGLTVGPRAHLGHGGYWLYAGDSPILHLSACPDLEGSVVTCRGFFNHISLSCTGLQATITHLVATKIPHRIVQLSDIGQTQVFITDPAGIGVELTFFDEPL